MGILKKLFTRNRGRSHSAPGATLNLTSPRVDVGQGPDQLEIKWRTPDSGRDKIQRKAELGLALANAIVKQDLHAVRSLQTEGATRSIRELPLAQLSRLILELGQIGRSPGFLSTCPGGDFDKNCWNIRSRQIGEELFRMGGETTDLMLAAYYYIESELGHIKAKDLSWTFHMIGDGAWMT